MTIKEYKDKVFALRVEIINKISKTLENTDKISGIEFRALAETTCALLQGTDDMTQLYSTLKDIYKAKDTEMQEGNKVVCNDIKVS